ncbi:MAG: hypothetical protein ACPGXY_03150 [Alphaproteobacteria bacterium]
MNKQTTSSIFPGIKDHLLALQVIKALIVWHRHTEEVQSDRDKHLLGPYPEFDHDLSKLTLLTKYKLIDDHFPHLPTKKGKRKMRKINEHI